MTRVEVICGWCREKFLVDSQRIIGQGENPEKWFSVKICPHCGRTVQASRKELTHNVVGRKRWKMELKNGDVV